MKYVLDTNVVSALRVPERHPQVASWAESVPLFDQYITAFTVAELERGIRSRMRKDEFQGAMLNQWFVEQVLPAFAGRVLPFDLDAARALGQYRVSEHAPYDGAQIAAVAESNGMILVTRNVKHVAPLGIRYLNPWELD